MRPRPSLRARSDACRIGSVQRGQDPVLQPEDHRSSIVSYWVLVSTWLFFLIRVIAGLAHGLVYLVPPVLPLGKMWQLAERMIGPGQVPWRGVWRLTRDPSFAVMR